MGNFSWFLGGEVDSERKAKLETALDAAVTKARTSKCNGFPSFGFHFFSEAPYHFWYFWVDLLSEVDEEREKALKTDEGAAADRDGLYNYVNNIAF